MIILIYLQKLFIYWVYETSLIVFTHMISLVPLRYCKYSINESFSAYFKILSTNQFKSISSPSRLFLTSYRYYSSSTSTSSPVHGSYHWLLERFIAVNTLGLLTGMMISPSEYYPWIDFGLGFILPLHGYLGMEAVMTDYLHRRKFPVLYPLSKFLLISVSVLTAYGLYQFNTNSIGICGLIKKLWAYNSQEVDK